MTIAWIPDFLAIPFSFVKLSNADSQDSALEILKHSELVTTVQRHVALANILIHVYCLKTGLNLSSAGGIRRGTYSPPRCKRREFRIFLETTMTKDSKPESADKEKKGPDTSGVKLDDAGRFELNEEELGEVSGGARKIMQVCCPSVTKCTVGSACRS
ncbi:hypothetical protein [Propionivibrio sp.]|uniref:hypothetical protein n=1 Tax=Propionivibrio sp. TaxID=2212460 RepID=UPI003BF02A33